MSLTERPAVQPPPVAGRAAVSVEIATGARLAEIQHEWRDLVARADVANVFMHPVLVALGTRYPNARSVTLLAWRDNGGNRQLAGLWAFTIGHAPRCLFPISALTAPPFAHAYLAAPVIDRDVLDEALQAMLDRIASDPALPNILALDGMRADGATMQALARVLDARGSTARVLRRSVRPMLACRRDAAPAADTMLSASTRKKLRQHRRRLAEQGALESKTITEPEAIGRAVDDFLNLEAAGWKGRERSALLCNPPDATFTREMMSALAPHGEAWIHALTLDGRPVSMQIVLRAGATAFTWKTAYDERLRDFSPGMLLLEDYTAAFLADPCVASVDSCAYDESSFMSVWDGRQAMAELWLDARRGGSAAFTHLSRLQDIYLRLRARAKAVRARLRRRG
ncbi:MAG TPA: GNAT family N-acetyltransferase [Pseudolabrys sp.]|nr:GNAT family N-acetyltransferase [Pseudolabrys sp.]